ncbi:MAG: hypothetical protein WCS34_07385 [Bacteroidales bacterium]
MYQDYKIVCTIASGRRKYMQYLMPQLLENNVVDRYDLWINTLDLLDIEFFKELDKRYPKINLVLQPEMNVSGISSINSFYHKCTDEDTIYIKIDDDVIWLEPDFFEKMINFRINHPNYFIVSPLVINNPLSTYILQNSEILKLTKYVHPDSKGKLIWRSGLFAKQIHEWFLNNYLIPNKYKDLYCGTKEVAINRMSINAILWFGKDMKAFGGDVPGDDEEFLSVIKPTQLGKSNGFNCDCIISHFAFGPQRQFLDKVNILEQYGSFLHKEWAQNIHMKELDDSIQEIMSDISKNKKSILTNKCPYRSNKQKTTIRSIFKKYKATIRYWNCCLSNTNYIK